jgi:hypothetical protein
MSENAADAPPLVTAPPPFRSVRSFFASVANQLPTRYFPVAATPATFAPGAREAAGDCPCPNSKRSNPRFRISHPPNSKNSAHGSMTIARASGTNNSNGTSQPASWTGWPRLPHAIRRLADKNFALLKQDPHHPSLHFKKVGRFSSAGVGGRHRALAVEAEDGIVWCWIGTHAEYDQLTKYRLPRPLPHDALGLAHQRAGAQARDHVVEVL